MFTLLVSVGKVSSIHVAITRTSQAVFYPILSYHILSSPTYPILSYSMLSSPTLPYPTLSYPILYYPILPYPILSYHTLPCPIQSNPIPFTPKCTGADRVLYTPLDKLFYFLSNAVTFFRLSVFFNDFSFICR